MKDGDPREGVLVVYGHCGAGRQASARESPHDALLVGAGLVRQLVGRTTAQSTIVARTPRGVVRQTAGNLVDTLAFVRRWLWRQQHFQMSHTESDVIKVPRALFERLTETLCYTT